jgi:hypothetical protein
MRIIAFITDASTVRETLVHVDEPTALDLGSRPFGARRHGGRAGRLGTGAIVVGGTKLLRECLSEP